MSIALRHWLVIASAALGIGLVAPAAYAFNPQPDPPAKGAKQIDPTTKNTASPGTLGVKSQGLLGDGSVFSNNGPSGAGNLPAVQRGGGSSRGAGAGIR
jgi:hypothetical protein